MSPAPTGKEWAMLVLLEKGMVDPLKARDALAALIKTFKEYMETASTAHFEPPGVLKVIASIALSLEASDPSPKHR